MEPRQLHYFVAIAQSGSFSAASKTLHIAQPALSRQIQNLEASLGIELFDRHARGVSLTPAGCQFLKDVKQIINLIEVAKDKAVRIDREKRASINIGLSQLYLLSGKAQRDIEAFQKGHPHLTVNLFTMRSSEQLVAIKEGRLDAGFVFFRPHNDPLLQGHALYEEPLKIATHKDSFLAKNPPRSLRDLECHPFIWAKNNALFDEIITRINQHDFYPVAHHHGYDYNSVLNLVAADLGYTFAPEVTHINNPFIRYFPLDDLNIELTLEFVWAKDVENDDLNAILHTSKMMQGASASLPHL